MIKSFLIFLLIGFCSFGFSDPLFQPIPMHLSPVQGGEPIAKNTTVSPLCSGANIIQCLSLNSLPFLSKDSSGVLTPQMFTSFFSPEIEMSSQRLNRLLRRGRWNAYEYSKKNSSFKKRKRRRIRRRPKRDSYTVYFKVDDPNSTAVVREIDRRGKEKISQGKVLAVPSSVLEVVSDEPKPPQPSAQTEKPEEKEKPTPPEELAPPPSSKEELPEPVRTPKVVVTQDVVPIRVTVQEQEINCLNLEDIKTEALAVCQECSSRDFSKGAMVQSMNKVGKKLKYTICSTHFLRNIKNNFNRTCSPLKFDEYVQFLACESCRANVPPALMLSLMTLESSGNCRAEQLNSREQSVGLFQVNVIAHRQRERRCTPEEKNQITRLNLESLKTKPQCLDNPVKNLKAGLRILKDHYKSLSAGPVTPSFQCQSGPAELTPFQTDQWRKALAGYNGGNRRIEEVKRLIAQNSRPEGVSSENWSKFSEWQKIRMYYFNCARRGVTSCRDNEFKNSINNLAYVETALGSRQGVHPRLLDKWSRLLPSLNDTSECR